MPSSRQSDRLTVQLTPELTARVLRYHREGGLPGRPQDSARELIQLGLSQPETVDPLIQSARQRAFKSVREDFYQLGRAAIAQLERDWEKVAAARVAVEGEENVRSEQAGPR